MDLEKEIEQIKQRNKKVELDKKWETSFTRRIMYINLYCSCYIFLFN